MSANYDGKMNTAQIVVNTDANGIVTAMITLGDGSDPIMMAQASPIVGQSETATDLFREAMRVAFQEFLTKNNVLNYSPRRTK